MKKIGMFLAVALVSLSLFSTPSLAKNWEYKAVNLTEGLEAQMMAMGMEQLNALLGGEHHPDEISQTEVFLALIEKRLNELGSNKWELVVVEQQMAIFKREKR